MRIGSSACVMDSSIFPILKGGIDSFVEQSFNNIDEAERQIAVLANELAKVGEILKQRLDQANIVLTNANMKLNLCEVQPPRYDENGTAHYPSCSSEKHDVRVAQEQVKAAENSLSQYNECLRAIEQKKAEYQSRRTRFMRLLDEVLREASSEMLRQWKLMEDYMENGVSYVMPPSTVFDSERLHPILRHFAPSINRITASFTKIDEMWQDSSAAIFKAEIIERWRSDTKEYLLALEDYAMSYEAVVKYANFYKVAPSDILVIQDDLDLSFGKYKIKTNSSDGGHNGIKSIINRLSSKEFARLKVGISHDRSIDTKDYVLGSFSKEDKDTFKEMQETFNKILNCFIKQGIDRTMNIYNTNAII